MKDLPPLNIDGTLPNLPSKDTEWTSTTTWTYTAFPKDNRNKIKKEIDKELLLSALVVFIFLSGIAFWIEKLILLIDWLINR